MRAKAEAGTTNKSRPIEVSFDERGVDRGWDCLTYVMVAARKPTGSATVTRPPTVTVSPDLAAFMAWARVE